MRYHEAFLHSHELAKSSNPLLLGAECPYCPYTLGRGSIKLQPLHVDDRSGVHFLICPECGEIFNRPDWYETPEERTIRVLMEKVANLEARITALERQPPPKQTPSKHETPPMREDTEAITLPNLRTV